MSHVSNPTTVPAVPVTSVPAAGTPASTVDKTLPGANQPDLPELALPTASDTSGLGKTVSRQLTDLAQTLVNRQNLLQSLPAELARQIAEILRQTAPSAGLLAQGLTMLTKNQRQAAQQLLDMAHSLEQAAGAPDIENENAALAAKLLQKQSPQQAAQAARQLVYLAKQLADPTMPQEDVTAVLQRLLDSTKSDQPGTPVKQQNSSATAEQQSKPPALPGQKQTATPAGQQTTTPTGQQTATPAGQQTATPAGQQTATPAGQQTTTPAGQQTATPAGQQTATPAGQQTATPAGQQTTTPAGQQTATPAGQQTTTPAGQQTATPAGQNATSSSPAAPAVNTTLRPELPVIQQLLSNFTGELPREQVRQLVKTLDSFIPQVLQQAAGKQNSADLPELWAILKTIELAGWKMIDRNERSQAAATLKKMAYSLARTSLPQGEIQSGNTVLLYTVPLYFGDNPAPYPAYIHLYHQRGEESGEPGEYETWLRVALSTENIGVVDTVFRLYKGKNLDIRIGLGDSEALQSLTQAMPALREALSGLPFHLNSMAVNSATPE